MQVVLEAVADAVSQLILFSVEAEEGKSVLQNISKGATGVSKAVGILVGIGEGLAANYGSEPKIQNQMRGAAGALKIAVQQMGGYAEQITAKGFTEQIKVSLMNTARSILQNTVEMLQLADSFDVQQITRAGRYVEDEVELVKNAKHQGDLQEHARALTHRTTNLQNLSAERITLLADPLFKNRLNSANQILRSDPEVFIGAARNVVANMGANVAEREALYQKQGGARIRDAVTEIILVCRLSQAHMWDRVNLDINAMMRGRLPPLDLLRSLAADVDREFDNLDRAVKNYDKPHTEEAMRNIGDGINKMGQVGNMLAESMPDPEQKRELLKALDKLERVPEKLKPLSNAVLDQPHNPQAKKDFDRGLQEARDANKAVVDAAMPPIDRLIAAHGDINKDLDRAVDRYQAKDPQGMQQALRDVDKDIDRAGDVARKLAADDPQALAKVNEILPLLKQMPNKIADSGNKSLARPGDKPLEQQFRKDVQDARDLAKALKEAVLPPEKELAHKGDELEKALRKLADALEDGNKEEALPLIKSVPEQIKDQAERYKDFAKSIPDPDRRAEMNRYADQMKNEIPPLLAASKALLQNPADPNAREALHTTIGNIIDAHRAALRLAEDEANKRKDMSGDLLDALNRLKRALDKLLDDAKKGKSPEAIQDVKDATGDMNKAAGIATSLADKLESPNRENAKRDAAHLKDLTTPLVQATKEALASPSPQTHDHLDKVVQEIKDTANKLPQHLKLTPDQLMQKHARELNDALDALYETAKDGKKKDKLDALQNQIPKLMNAQADRAAAAAPEADHPLRKAQLRNDAEAMRALVPPVVPTSSALYQQPNSPEKDVALQDLIDRIKAVNDRMADPASALQTPGDRVMKALEDVQRKVHEPNVDGTKEALRRLNANAPDLIAEAEGVLATLKDAPSRKALQDAIRAFEKDYPGLGAKAVPSAQNPGNPNMRKALDEAVERLKRLCEALANAALNASTEKKICDLAEQTDKDQAALSDAAKVGDRGKMREDLQKLLDDLKKQAQFARDMSDQSDDPQRKKAFRDIGDAMEAIVPRLQAVIEKLVANPFDKEALKELDKIQNEIKDLNDKLVDLLRAETDAKLQKALDDLNNAAKRGDDVVPHLKKVAELVKKQAYIAKALAARQADAKRRRDLLQAAKDLNDSIRNLLDASKTAPDRNAKLERESEHIRDLSNSLKPPADDPFMAAAEAISSGLSKAKTQTLADQPEGSAAKRMLQGAGRIAELMALLAKAAKEKNKAEMIRLARLIAEACSGVDKAANELAGTCKDVKLRNALLAYAAPLKNFGVQLKILASVKASTAEDDPTTKQQLVTCAKGIANSVVMSCNAAESCLVVMKGATNELKNL